MAIKSPLLASIIGTVAGRVVGGPLSTAVALKMGGAETWKDAFTVAATNYGYHVASRLVSRIPGVGGFASDLINIAALNSLANALNNQQIFKTSTDVAVATKLNPNEDALAYAQRASVGGAADLNRFRESVDKSFVNVQSKMQGLVLATRKGFEETNKRISKVESRLEEKIYAVSQSLAGTGGIAKLGGLRSDAMGNLPSTRGGRVRTLLPGPGELPPLPANDNNANETTITDPTRLLEQAMSKKRRFWWSKRTLGKSPSPAAQAALTETVREMAGTSGGGLSATGLSALGLLSRFGVGGLLARLGLGGAAVAGVGALGTMMGKEIQRQSKTPNNDPDYGLPYWMRYLKRRQQGGTGGGTGESSPFRPGANIPTLPRQPELFGGGGQTDPMTGYNVSGQPKEAIRPGEETETGPSRRKGSSETKIPKNIDADTIAAINKVAKEHNIDPAAISGLIKTESNWNSKASKGSYHGLTQIGLNTMKEAGWGITPQDLLQMPPAKQVEYYGKWLDHYKFNQQLEKHGIDFSKLPTHLQAAYLQGMQFAPNAEAWKRAFAQGNYNIPTTATRQASALGSTSINDMARHYEKMLQQNTPTDSISPEQLKQINANRPLNMQGTLMVPGEERPFRVGSGGVPSKEGPGYTVPFGSYTLGRTGAESRVDAPHGQITTKSLYVAGPNREQTFSDPQQRQGRSGILIHGGADMKKLVSQGCIKMSTAELNRFLPAFEKAVKQYGPMVLNVAPGSDGLMDMKMIPKSQMPPGRTFLTAEEAAKVYSGQQLDLVAKDNKPLTAEKLTLEGPLMGTSPIPKGEGEFGEGEGNTNFPKQENLEMGTPTGDEYQRAQHHAFPQGRPSVIFRRNNTTIEEDVLAGMGSRGYIEKSRGKQRTQQDWIEHIKDMQQLKTGPITPDQFRLNLQHIHEAYKNPQERAGFIYDRMAGTQFGRYYQEKEADKRTAELISQGINTSTTIDQYAPTPASEKVNRDIDQQNLQDSKGSQSQERTERNDMKQIEDPVHKIEEKENPNPSEAKDNRNKLWEYM